MFLIGFLIFRNEVFGGLYLLTRYFATGSTLNIIKLKGYRAANSGEFAGCLRA